MAPASTYLMDPTVTLSTTVGTVVTTYDITDQVSGVELSQEATVLKRTTFGNTWDRNGRGLKRGSIKFDFYVNFDADGVFETFKALWDNHETVDFELEEAGGAKSSGSFVMAAMPSFAGKVDEYNVASLTFTLDGPVVNTERA